MWTSPHGYDRSSKNAQTTSTDDLGSETAPRASPRSCGPPAAVWRASRTCLGIARVPIGGLRESDVYGYDDARHHYRRPPSRPVEGGLSDSGQPDSSEAKRGMEAVASSG